MQVTVSGKQVDIGEAFQAYAEDHLVDLVGKYLEHAVDSTVTLSRAGHGMRADISVHAGRGVTVQAHGEANEAHPAFDAALERIAKRLRRYKRRIKDHRRKEKATAKEDAVNVQRYIIAAEDTGADDELGEAGDNPAVIAENTREIDIISVSEAVMRLELSERAAIVFTNAGNGNLNVVYRRRDGNIGWIDPQSDNAA
jgi:ribosomal subunit interface protein